MTGGSRSGSWLVKTPRQPSLFSCAAIHSRPRRWSFGSKPKPGVIISRQLRGVKAAGDISDSEKALRCLDAGADLLLEILDVEGTVQTLEQAVRDGKLDEARIDESVLRVLRMKLDYGLL